MRSFRLSHVLYMSLGSITSTGSLAICRGRKLALGRELHGEFWVDSKGREQVGILVGAEAAYVSVRKRRAAVCRGCSRGRRSHRRLACHQPSNRDFADGALGIRNITCHG
ncbi:hypothetical protein OIU74_008097 [Salix koriyanagi]|uniref:Uncharacterized protein n=1 Tax=Salix koriyanagi TaxID=2511006 RepID=A0A9Q0U562_9ROSI|nr:hypothetical protein OIU74_008097 [Salix koriyanagi]